MIYSIFSIAKTHKDLYCVPFFFWSGLPAQAFPGLVAIVFQVSNSKLQSCWSFRLSHSVCLHFCKNGLQWQTPQLSTRGWVQPPVTRCTLGIEAALEGAPSSASIRRTIIPPPDSSQANGAQESRSNKEQNSRKTSTEGEEKNTKKRLKELFEDLLPVPWYAENTLYEFVTFNDWSKIQKQARISQVLQTTEPIKSWWVFVSQKVICYW